MIVSLLFFISSFLGFNSPKSASKVESKISTTKSANNDDKKFVLLELFTSEGCSSCPAADEALIDLAKQTHVYVLGYHVSYWNRLGWTDAFSNKSFDQRQYAYGDRFKKEGVYTPEVIINGIDATVGSRKSYVQQKIDSEKQKTPETDISVNSTLENGSVLKINWSISGNTKNSVVNFAVVESDISTKVKNGENGGRTLRHVNVVRDILTQNISQNQQGTANIAIQKDWKVNNLKLIAFTQENGLGKITSATSVGLQ